MRGCGASNQCVDSNAQPLVDVLLTGVAQVAPAIQTNRLFGHSIALSADGNTLAAVSSENDPNQPGQGTVYIFQRGDDGRWVQEARLERFSIAASFGPPLALSGDGQTLVVGAYEHTGTVGGISTGAIHVFIRDRQQRQWSPQAFLKAAVPVESESLGFGRVAVSHDGHRALAAAFSRMYLFERTNGQWRQAPIFDSSSGAIDPTVGMALSADGRSIAVKEGAIYPNPLPQSVTVYKECQCSEGWRPVAKLSSARPPPDIRFPSDNGDEDGRSLSFSSDGNVLAVGAPFDSGDEACDGTTMNTAAPAAGAVYVFAADSSGVWQRRAFLKARTALRLDQLGGEVALSGDGKVLAAKACGVAADAQGLRRNHRAGDSIGQQPGEQLFYVCRRFVCFRRVAGRCVVTHRSSDSSTRRTGWIRLLLACTERGCTNLRDGFDVFFERWAKQSGPGLLDRRRRTRTLSCLLQSACRATLGFACPCH